MAEAGQRVWVRSRARNSSRRRRRMIQGLAFVSPWIFGFLAFTVGPMLVSLFYSFTNYDMVHAPRFIGVANYTDMLQDPQFAQAFEDTLIMVFIMVPLSVGTSLLYGALMSVTLQARGLYRTILYLPSLVPAVAAALLWEWLFNAQYGLINGLLSLVGIQGPLCLVDSRWTLPALIIISLWGAGNSAVLFLAALKGVRRDLYEQAIGYARPSSSTNTHPPTGCTSHISRSTSRQWSRSRSGSMSATPPVSRSST